MKVIYIIHSLPVGGAETLVVNYILKLNQAGIDICLVERYHTETYLSTKIQNSGIPYYTLCKTKNRIINLFQSFFYDDSLKKLNDIISDFQPDVIHYHTVFKDIEKVNFPIEMSVFTFHSRVERFFTIYSYVRSIMERLSRKGMIFIAISKLLHEDIKHFLPCAQIVDIPNGVDLEHIRAQKGKKKDLCEMLSIPEDSFIVGQVGRFNPVKNHLFTIHLFKDILHKKEKAHLVLVGTGNEGELRLIKNEIAKYDLESHVHLMGLRKDATKIMSCFDTLVLPSLSESFSLVLIEAQANNVRCVASDAVPLDVICNSNCFAMPLTGSKQQWINTICGINVRNTATSLEKFDIDVIVSQHISLYKSLLKYNYGFNANK